ncbi:Rho GDP-dissociation inhibitor 1 [Hibiscus syriacus]|uniref:Rho GDP-dissociation inhibitor 1 n=1 Tax=Hibiscus syriacus TaxID=106335 RepID=A0A6A3BKJ3_HIBSY|nr:Rho GDP-dissociation inhibitor 1 [Hibiscus syriacus]
MLMSMSVGEDPSSKRGLTKMGLLLIVKLQRQKQHQRCLQTVIKLKGITLGSVEKPARVLFVHLKMKTTMTMKRGGLSWALTLKNNSKRIRIQDDESLRRWKEQLLGSVDFDSVGGIEKLEPDVKILSFAIKSPGRPDMVLPIPDNGKPKGPWFTLKEGSKYTLQFTFQVSNNIVSGLKYTNMVWKTGVKVDSTKEMIGTFSPQAEPYTHEISDETTPSGIFARGFYSARSKFVDNDSKCYLESETRNGNRR